MSNDQHFVIKHDGTIVAEVASESDAWAWLHRHQGQSVEWALRYGGYRIEGVEAELNEYGVDRLDGKVCVCGHKRSAHDVGIGICDDCSCDQFVEAES